MEEKIKIIVNNEKYFYSKNKLNLESITNTIKRLFSIRNSNNIEIYDETNINRINSVNALEKLKEKNKDKEVVIRLNFKVGDMPFDTPKRQQKTMIFPSKKSLNLSEKRVNTSINEVKNSLKIDNSSIIEMDLGNDEKIKDELEQYKKKQEEEIESLEKELNELEKKNNESENMNNIHEDIVLNYDMFLSLKNDIINEITLKLNEELKTNKQAIEQKLEETNDNNIKTYENRVNDEINNLKKEIINNNIAVHVNKINTKLKLFESKINNSFIIKKNSGEIRQNNNPNRVDKRIVIRNNNIEPNNIKILDKSGNIDNNSNSPKKIMDGKNEIKYDKKFDKFIDDRNIDKNINNINNNGEDVVDDEDIKIDSIKNTNFKQNITNFNRQSQNQNNKMKGLYVRNKNGNKIYFNVEGKDKPKIPQINKINLEKSQTNVKQKKNQLNLLDLFNMIFFVVKDKSILGINPKMMTDNQKQHLKNLYYNKQKEEKTNNNIIYVYANSFIQNNVLKYFKKKNVDRDLLEVLKYNISSVLECIGMNKDFYSSHYNYDLNRERRGRVRQSSIDAAALFRKEFNIKEEDLNQDVLIQVLGENNDDIFQAFGTIYGK